MNWRWRPTHGSGDHVRAVVALRSGESARPLRQGSGERRRPCDHRSRGRGRAGRQDRGPRSARSASVRQTCPCIFASTASPRRGSTTTSTSPPNCTSPACCCQRPTRRRTWREGQSHPDRAADHPHHRNSARRLNVLEVARALASSGSSSGRSTFSSTPACMTRATPSRPCGRASPWRPDRRDRRPNRRRDARDRR